MLPIPHIPPAKIAVPQLPPEFVVRAGLRADLEAADPADVGLICAPAGYGKTLLLADWVLNSTATDVAWVGLGCDDNDPKRLWASVIAAVAACPSVPSDIRQHAPRVLRPADQPEFLAELGLVLQRLPRPIRLILDDVHELVDREVLHGVQIFVRNCPASVQLVLSSRLDPPLGLRRLRLTGRLWELRAERLRFSEAEAASLLERSHVHLTPEQVQMLHQRTGGWAAGLRLAALAVAADGDGLLATFSGDERSVADYLVEEIISQLPDDIRQLLRVTSISDPMPSGLAAHLSGREDAGSVLDRLEHQTSLVSATGPRRDAYRIQELLRTYLLADLQRQGPTRAADLHARAARWWAGQDRPIHALDHASRSGDHQLLSGLLHRFAVPLILNGDHAPLRRALCSLRAQTTAPDPWLALTSALTHAEAGDMLAAEADLRQARSYWPSQNTADLTVLRAAAEQLTTVSFGAEVSPTAVMDTSAAMDIDELAIEPELEALARLSRGSALLREHNDREGARADLEIAMMLARRNGFDYLSMQCLVLLGVIAGISGDLRTMHALSTEADAAISNHHWERTMAAAAVSAMLAYTALLRSETHDALDLSAQALALGPVVSPPLLRFALQMVHGAATFDRGDRVGGLAELQHARAQLGERHTSVEQAASAAVLEFRAALLLGHTTAARTVQGWLAERTDSNAELLLMRTWAEAACGRPRPARVCVHRVLDGTVPALLPHTRVEAFLLEAALAAATNDQPAARHALQAALATAEPLDTVRPFTQASPSVRALLTRLHGSFGETDAFAQRVLTAGAGGQERQTTLSEREITVLGLLPSLLSLDEIATDLTVSVNTVKSHVRSIYVKLGVSSRRMAVYNARERGLLVTSWRSN
jgi:LuxR family maltose regulon positive regulatory protein